MGGASLLFCDGAPVGAGGLDRGAPLCRFPDYYACMIRLAFSTVACPTWTLERVAAAASHWGYLGVELRTFGQGGSQFASDPGLIDGRKLRRVLDDAGAELAGLATGVRFDAPIFPPVLGQLMPWNDASVREGRHMVSIARECGTEYVRVYAFELAGRERTSAAIKRIAGRLSKVCDQARNRDVTVLLENGGGFARAADILEIIEAVNSPQLAACYDGAAAWQAGEDVAQGCALLAGRLRMVRVRDVREGRPARLGMGDAPCRALVRAAVDADAVWGTDPWVVYTWDRAWLPELSPAEEVLPHAAPLIAEWAGQSLGQRRRYKARQSAAPAMMI